MTDPRLTDVVLPDVRLAALEWGPADGPLALLLHGFPDTAYTWRHLGPELASRGWHVVAPFTRGYAPSAVPADGRTDVGALMADAVGLHAALGGADDAVLVGHDWGAVTANALAAHRESPYRQVVAMAEPGHRRSIVDYYRAVARPIGVPDRYRRWQASTVERPLVPTLYLHGRTDGCMDARFAALVAPVLPTGSAVLDDAGHFLHLERPEAVRDLVVPFLES